MSEADDVRRRMALRDTVAGVARHFVDDAESCGDRALVDKLHDLLDEVRPTEAEPARSRSDLAGGLGDGAVVGEAVMIGWPGPVPSGNEVVPSGNEVVPSGNEVASSSKPRAKLEPRPVSGR